MKMSKDLTTLLKASNEPVIGKMTRQPVEISLSLNEIKRYIAQESDDYLVYQWCQAYIKRYNQIG